MRKVIDKVVAEKETTERVVDMEEKFTFLKEEWFMWVMLVIFSPIGIYLMLKYNKKLKENTKLLIMGGSLILFALVWVPILVNSQSSTTNKPITEQIATENKQAVQEVEKKIKMIGDPKAVSLENIEEIKEVKKAYNRLSSEQKGMIAYNNLKILVIADDNATIIENKAKEQKAMADKVAAEEVAAEKAVAEKAAVEKAAAEKAVADKAAAEKAAADKATAEKAAADKVAAEKVAAEEAAAQAESGIMPASTEWREAAWNLYTGVDLYYLSHKNEGIRYATVLGFSDNSKVVECYMYESDTIKSFNRRDPQFTGSFLKVRADDPYLP